MGRLGKGATGANRRRTRGHGRTGNAMLQRRRGRAYVTSEWLLRRLKRGRRFQAALPAFAIFLLRRLTRLLPAKWLGKIYAKLRT